MPPNLTIESLAEALAEAAQDADRIVSERHGVQRRLNRRFQDGSPGQKERLREMARLLIDRMMR